VRVYCDFDGTITTEDTTDAVLRALAHPDWETLEDDWTCGRLSAAECMRRQIALIQGDDAAIGAVLDCMQLRNGFLEFVAWCRRRGIALVVVSDGVDRFIRHVLARHGITDLPVIANRLAGVPGARALEQPWSVRTCAAGSGVCKCRIARTEVPEELVYIGDGRSDFCVAGTADLLFARGALVGHCRASGLRYLPFESFADVQAALARRRRQPRGTAPSAAAPSLELPR
jgi:2,3-diketo-5-methylthio-1-phosphopentane phosphatase